MQQSQPSTQMFMLVFGTTKGVMRLTHPNDDNGDVLRRMEANGDDLDSPRDINFSVVFPDEISAESFAERFRYEGYLVRVELSGVKEECPWDVTVVKHMMPSHSGITEFEQEVADFAKPLGGFNDGWGCFSQPGKHIQ